MTSAGIACATRAAGTALTAAALLAPVTGPAQERASQAFQCQGENACRVRCVGLADVARVRHVMVERAP